MALTQEQIKNLKVGQPLRLTTRLEMSKYDLEAKVVVVKIGKVGCLVEVTEILSKGMDQDSATIDGNQFAVTFAELEIIPE